MAIIAPVLPAPADLLPMMPAWLNPKADPELGYVAIAAGRNSLK